MRVEVAFKSGATLVEVGLRNVAIRDGYLVTDRGKTNLDRIEVIEVKP